MKNNKPLLLTAGIIIILIAVICISGCAFAQTKPESVQHGSSDEGNQSQSVLPDGNISLPDPDHTITTSLDAALEGRRSVREFQNTSLTVQQLSHILWAAQGITDESGRRTAPSGQRIYPLTLHVIASRIDGLSPGVYSYSAPDNVLIPELDESGMSEVKQALGQKSVQSAPVSIVMGGNYSPYQKFGTDMANQSIYLEAGHVAQNILLELNALTLSGVPFSGFSPVNVQEALGIPENEHVIYAIAFGQSIA
jgi:SagB-type dehydrogenase family enzyme